MYLDTRVMMLKSSSDYFKLNCRSFANFACSLNVGFKTKLIRKTLFQYQLNLKKMIMIHHHEA